MSIGKLLQALAKQAMARAFSQCFQAQGTAGDGVAGDGVAGDGQRVRSTVETAQQAGQTFVSGVSLSAQGTGLRVALQDYTDKKTGELALLRPLLADFHADFQDRGVGLPLDALQGPKKQPPPA